MSESLNGVPHDCHQVGTDNVQESEKLMMSEIYQRGPIVCAVACDDNFDYGYDGGEAEVGTV